MPVMILSGQDCGLKMQLHAPNKAENKSLEVYFKGYSIVSVTSLHIAQPKIGLFFRKLK